MRKARGFNPPHQPDDLPDGDTADELADDPSTVDELPDDPLTNDHLDDLFDDWEAEDLEAEQEFYRDWQQRFGQSDPDST